MSKKTEDDSNIRLNVDISRGLHASLKRKVTIDGLSIREAMRWLIVKYIGGYVDLKRLKPKELDSITSELIYSLPTIEPVTLSELYQRWGAEDRERSEERLNTLKRLQKRINFVDDVAPSSAKIEDFVYEYGDTTKLDADREERARIVDKAMNHMSMEQFRQVFRDAMLDASRDVIEEERQRIKEEENANAGESLLRLTDKQWRAVKHTLPRQPPTERKRKQDRQVLNSLLYKRQTGCSYAALPRTDDYALPATTRHWEKQWEGEGVLGKILYVLFREIAGDPEPD